MGQTRNELTASIAVIADNDGSHHTVEEYTRYTSHQPIAGAQEWRPGSREYFVDGEDCNKLDENTFQVVLTDQVLRRA